LHVPHRSHAPAEPALRGLQHHRRCPRRLPDDLHDDTRERGIASADRSLGGLREVLVQGACLSAALSGSLCKFPRLCRGIINGRVRPRIVLGALQAFGQAPFRGRTAFVMDSDARGPHAAVPMRRFRRGPWCERCYAMASASRSPGAMWSFSAAPGSDRCRAREIVRPMFPALRIRGRLWA
jgi:hypothetical protein